MQVISQHSGNLAASARRALTADCPHVVAADAAPCEAARKLRIPAVGETPHRLRLLVTSFPVLGVPARLSDVLARQGIETPTPIQAATLPDSFAGRDVLGRGRTGSGKTYAFLLPLVARLSRRRASAPRRPARPDPRPDPRARRPDRRRPGARCARAAGLTTRTVFGGVGQQPQVAALQARRRHRRRLPRPARGPDRSGPLHPRRHPGHRPRRGRPHGRPRLPARRTPDPRPDAEGRPAPAVLRHPRQGDRHPGPSVPATTR